MFRNTKIQTLDGLLFSLYPHLRQWQIQTYRSTSDSLLMVGFFVFFFNGSWERSILVLAVEICNWPTAKIHSTSRLVFFFFNLNLFKFGCKIYLMKWNHSYFIKNTKRQISLSAFNRNKETLLTRKYTSITVLLTVLPGNVYKLML